MDEYTENNCSLCFYSERAKGLAEHIYCTKKGEYRRPSGKVCDSYLYDIIKRPVRRRPAINKNVDFKFDI